MSRMRSALMALILIFQVPGIVWADVPANIPLNRSFYVSMVGEKQGKLLGGPITPIKGREGWMEGLWLEHVVYAPIDQQTGLQTGQRVHKPLNFVKPFDQASPLLFKSLTTNEIMRQVFIDFVRMDTASGVPVNYGRVELDNARLINIRRFTQGTQLLEEVALVYQKIIITYRPTGTSGEDTVPR